MTPINFYNPDVPHDPTVLGVEDTLRLLMLQQMALDIRAMSDFEDAVREFYKLQDMIIPAMTVQEIWRKYRGDTFENIAPTHDILTGELLDASRQSWWRRKHHIGY